MPSRLRYQLLDEFPHIPKDILRVRLDARSAPHPSGCRLWTGARHSGKYSGGGMLRVMMPSGRSDTLPATKLTWWVEHGHYPREPQMVGHKCCNPLCVTLDHLRLQDRESQKKLTDEQVAEARALYWRPSLRLTPQQRAMKPPTPTQLAAWRLGMSPSTVARILAGERTVPGMWQGYAKSKVEVRMVVAACQQEHEARLADRQSVWTMQALGQRYGLSQGCVHRLLHGEGYRHVPMPPESRLKVQRQAQEEVGEARQQAARQQQRSWVAASTAGQAAAHALDRIRLER